jgi:shikimate dehydrogenase
VKDDGASGVTRTLALLGDPVAHSLSPRIQAAALDGLGLDAVYVALRCDAHDLPGLLRGLAHAGGAGNVTVPHKVAAARAVDRLTPAARATGACNCFWMADGAIQGDNTDVVGTRRALEDLAGGCAGAEILLLGAGGAAAGVLQAVLEGGARRVTVVNRTPERAERLLARMDPDGERTRSVRVTDIRGGTYDLAVNATSLGLHPDDPLPLDPGLDTRIGAALDLVYAARRTRWVRTLRSAGVRADDGLGVLLYQGAAAFERWWNRPAPIEVMRAALPGRDADEPALHTHPDR